MELSFYNGGRSMFRKQTINAAGNSLRKFLIEKIPLPCRTAFAMPRKDTGARILRLNISTNRHRPECADAAVKEFASTLRTIIHPVEAVIAEWLKNGAAAILDTDPVINEKAPEGGRAWQNESELWPTTV